MSKLNGMQIFELLSDVDDSLIAESVAPALLVGGATVGAASMAGTLNTTASTAAKTGFGAWLAKGGWVALTAGVLVAAGIVAGAFFLGKGGDMPPAKENNVTTEEEDQSLPEEDITEESDESEGDSVTEEPTEAENPTETQPAPEATEGLNFISYDSWVQIDTYTGSADTVVIPPVWDGIPVTSISYGAFSRDALSGHSKVNDQITEVILPDTIVRIGKHAFLRCRKLKSIHIPASVTDIDPTAFQECTGLESITVDEENPVYRAAGNCLIDRASGTVIAGCASSVIPDDGSIKVIGSAAFYKCTALTEINIPASVTELARGAFHGCTSLVRVGGGESLVTIGEEAFRDCTALAGFSFSETVKTIGINSFRNCEALTEIVLPREMDHLGNFAFLGCEGLTRVEMPSSLKFNGYKSLSGTALTSMTVPEGYTKLSCMLESTPKLETVYLPATLEKINDTEFSFCYELTDIYFGGTLENWLAITEQDQVWMCFVREWTLHCADGVTQWQYVRGYGMQQVL